MARIRTNSKILKPEIFILLTFAMVLGVSQGSTVSAQPDALGQAGGKWEAGAEVHAFRYEEPDIMDETGVMYGIFGKYTYRTQENQPLREIGDLFGPGHGINVFAVEGKFSYGQVDYDSRNTGSIDDIDDFLTEIRLLAGYDLPVGARNLLTPYLGFGYRYWFDDLGGRMSTTGHFGYDRESQYFYLPIGAAFNMLLDDGWSVMFTAEYDLFIDGQQKSHLEDVSASLSTLDNDQDDGYGVRGSVRLTKSDERVDLFVEPFVRYWHIESSDIGVITCGGTPCALGYEPKNNTLEAGVRLGGAF